MEQFKALSPFSFTEYGAKAVTQEVLKECSDLFSAHYGKWGVRGVRPGEQVRLSAIKLKQQYLWNEDTCVLVTARNPEGKLIGHAFGCHFEYEKGDYLNPTPTYILF